MMPAAIAVRAIEIDIVSSLIAVRLCRSIGLCA
jgi:hypothetical protein